MQRKVGLEAQGARLSAWALPPLPPRGPTGPRVSLIDSVNSTATFSLARPYMGRMLESFFHNRERTANHGNPKTT